MRSARPLNELGAAQRVCARLAVVTVAAMLLLAPMPPASAQDPAGGSSLQELQRQREAVRADKAARASSVDALRADDAQIGAALDALTAEVNAGQEQLEEAERAVRASDAARVDAEAAQDRARTELADIKAQLGESAVALFVSVGSADASSAVVTSNVNDAVNKRVLLGMRSAGKDDLVEQYRSVQEDLRVQQRAAEDAAAEARTRQGAVTTQLATLNEATARQQEFATQVDDRIDKALAEADSLAALDSQLSASITTKELEVARIVAAQRAADRLRAEQLAAAAAASAAAAATRSPAARTPAGPRAASSSADTRTGGAPPAITGAGEIVTVGGIRVHQSIAGDVQALLQAATSDGVQLGGGGYRDAAGQIATRRNNCGSSNYALYEAPASSCSPPTARPGQSMHERGLAIDFTMGGSVLNRSSPGFRWLQSNAARFGLRNLPSEPWHWSTNGQ